MTPADFDSDGYVDLVTLDFNNGVIRWHENTDGVGGSWTASVIHAPASYSPDNRWSNMYADPLVVADVDGDGHADLIGFGADGTFVSLSNDIGVF